MVILILQKPRKTRPRLEKMKRIERKKTKRETLQVIAKAVRDNIESECIMSITNCYKLQVSRATIDLTSDAMTDMSSDAESYDGNQSPMRRVQKLIHSSIKVKPRRKKKMPPELKIIKAPVTFNFIAVHMIYFEGRHFVPKLGSRHFSGRCFQYMQLRDLR